MWPSLNVPGDSLRRRPIMSLVLGGLLCLNATLAGEPPCPSVRVPDGATPARRMGISLRVQGGITLTTRQLMTQALKPTTARGKGMLVMPPPEAKLKAGNRKGPFAFRSATQSGTHGPAPVKDALPSTPPSFTGATLADTGAFPPDTMGAVGPAQFLVTVNGRVRTFDKATLAPDAVLDTTLDDFFGPALCVTMPCSDPPGDTWTAVGPRVRYDRFTGCWFVVAGTTGAFAPPNRILIAVSDAASNGVISSATQWTLFWLDVLDPPDGTLAESPSLAIDSRSLYLGIDYTSGGSPFRSDGYAVAKSDLLSDGMPGDVNSAYVFENLGYVDASNPYGVFSPLGVDSLDSAVSDAGYFIGADALQFGFIDYYLVGYDLAGALTGTLVGPTSIMVPQTSYSQPSGIPHKNGDIGLAALDDRLYSAQLRGGVLWTAHHIGVDHTGDGTLCSNTPSNPDCRTGIRWYAFSRDPADGTLSLPGTGWGTVFDPTDVQVSPNLKDYWMPSIMASGQGNVAIGFSAAGNDAYVNAGVAYGMLQDGALAMSGPVLYTNSSTSYNPSGDGSGGGALHPWGRYSFTSLDPCDDMTMWTIQEYCNATDSYGVRVAKLTAPPPAVDPAFVIAADPPPALTITGSGFYDYNPTGLPPGCASHRIAATLGGTPIPVTSSSPSQLTLGIDASTLSGLYIVSVTNPDGQTATSTLAVLTTAPPEIAVGTTYSDAQKWTDINTITWPASPWAGSYTVYRGSKDDLPHLLDNQIDSCIRYAGSVPEASAGEDPTSVSGRFYWYLVTGTNLLGEGSAGSATGGPRVVNAGAPCP